MVFYIISQKWCVLRIFFWLPVGDRFAFVWATILTILVYDFSIYIYIYIYICSYITLWLISI